MLKKVVYAIAIVFETAYIAAQYTTCSGFGGLEVPEFAGSNPAEAVGFFGRKNPQHAFLRRGSKAVDPIS